jgi:hypothetical protein
MAHLYRCILLRMDRLPGELYSPSAASSQVLLRHWPADREAAEARELAAVIQWTLQPTQGLAGLMQRMMTGPAKLQL